MLMSIAASAFTMIAWGMFHEMQDPSGEPTNADPIRLVEAVKAGIAFLGARARIPTRNHVRGITTRTGLWTAGAIGVATGCGYYSNALDRTSSVQGTSEHVLVTLCGRRPSQ